MEEEDDSEDLLNLLFERGPDFVLIESAKTGDEEMVRLLIENEEVNLNTEDDYGYTALCYAALKGLLFWYTICLTHAVFETLKNQHKEKLSHLIHKIWSESTHPELKEFEKFHKGNWK